MDDYNKILEMFTTQINNMNCNSKELSNKTNIADSLTSMNPQAFTALATILGFTIANGLTINQQNSIGNFLELVGQVILTVSAQGSTLQSNDNSGLKEQLDLIKKQIEIIEKNLK